MPLDKTDDMGDWIKDFQKSDAPQFKGKSQDKRRQMAIAAKLATENNALREANITIYEKRAFILAAKQAFLDGKKTFVFKEKEYKCTVREEQDIFGELTDYLLHKKEDVDTATMADVDDGADAPDDIEPEDLESARDHAAQRFKKFNSEESEVDVEEGIKPYVSMLKKDVRGRRVMHYRVLDKDEKEILITTDKKKAEKFLKKNYNKLKTGSVKPIKESEVDENIKIKAFKNATDKTKKGLEISKTGGMGGTIMIKNKKELKDLETQLAKAKRQHKLAEGTKDRAKFKMDSIKLMRRVKATNKGHKIAIEDLLTMAPYKVLEGMFKKNPRGFIDMLMKMNPKRDKLQVGDYMIDGRFVAPNGNLLSVDQTKKLTEDTVIQESVEYHDRESMPSAVDDAANVMSKLDVYTNFIKKTY